MAFIYDLTDTWNAGGTTFNAIKMNVTDSASAAASKLITAQIGGVERFGVRKDGQGYFAGNVGIGTTDPGYRLDVASADTSFGYAMRLRSNSTAATAMLQFTNSAVTQQNAVIAATDAGNLVLQADGAASLVAFRTNGAERMRITAAGDVGIGTSSPGSTLDVNGVTTFRGSTNQTTGAHFTSNGNGLWMNGFANFGSGITSDSAGTAVRLWTSSTERMRIDSSGNLLVGTTSSTSGRRMDVQGGNVFFLSNLGSNSYGSWLENANTAIWGIRATATKNACLSFTEAGVADRWAVGVKGGDASLIFASGTVDIATATERMRIDASGNVGIGTAAPQQTAAGRTVVGVNGSSSSLINIGSGGNFGSYWFWDGTTATLAANNSLSLLAGASPILFNNSGVERARIGANGSFAIGGTGVDASLHIQQAYGGYDRLTQISPNGASKNGFNLMSAKNASNSDLWWSWGVRNDNVWCIQQGVDYSMTSSIGIFFDSGGQAYKSGGGTWASTSDVRVKTNIALISDAANRIMALKPSSFDYRVPEAHEGRVSDRGFIAQEFEEVYPHSVSESAMVGDAEKSLVEGDEKIKAISLSTDFFADLVALVQEQQATISDLRARMAQLETSASTITFEGN